MNARMVGVEFVTTRVSKERSVELFEAIAGGAPGSVIWLQSEEESNFVNDLMRNSGNGKVSAVLNIT